MRTLDFKSENVQLLTLDELQATYKEALVTGVPVCDIYHFELIGAVLDIFGGEGLNPEVTEIFAANNRDSKRPGVTLLPQLEEKYGERALEAHLLRRVFANIAIRDGETQDMVTNLAVAYHQKGIQVAIGPMVKVCHNQTILGALDVASTYSCWGGKWQKATKCEKADVSLDGVLAKVKGWAANFTKDQEERRFEMDFMMSQQFTREKMYKTIGVLQEQRIRHDSANVRIHDSTPYPLNNSQINATSESLLIAMHDRGETGFTFWDAYQCLNAVLKPQSMDVAQILPQGMMLYQVLHDVMTGHYD